VQPGTLITLADGETDDLATHRFFLGDRFMEVRFFFRDGGLTTVQLVPESIDPARPKENAQLARMLSERLTEQYGPPFDCGDQSSAGVHLFRCKWIAKPTIVRLWYLDVEGEAPVLLIAFREVGDASYDF
jgi:hypothetical protein